MVKKASEKAWVDRHTRSKKMPFLEFVRYMRWYCRDSRSYLYLKLHPRVLKEDGEWTPATAKKVVPL